MNYDTSEEAIWKPPAYSFASEPALASVSTLKDDGFPRNAQWTLDGSAVLVQCEDHTLQVFDSFIGGDVLKPTISIPQPGPVVATQWFPAASKENPAAYCLVASVRDTPVKLLDASNGRLRASYPIVDHRERQIAPQSLAFTFPGDKLYCGFEDAIEVFDVGRPGEGTRLHTTPSRKSKDGLKGIISSLAFSSFYGSEDSLFAAGTFSPVPGNIALFTESQGETPAMYIGGGPRAGVVQMQFNPMRPYVLYAAYRATGAGLIYSWDIRTNVDLPLAIYDSRPRTDMEGTGRPVDAEASRRNQRMSFGLDVGGRYLGIGNWAGEISVFDLEKAEGNITEEPSQEGDVEKRGPEFRFSAHKDTIGSVSFRPWNSQILSVSGSRHWPEDEDSGSSGDEEEQRDASEPQPSRYQKRAPKPVVSFDSSMKLWECQPKADANATGTGSPIVVV
ncbi:hypothetical protein FA15DRAFT_648298 [Coprinopsis marcescibilis]|uniref:WD40 repeat-like protein n=1 Tax=Coprinopsis marcescibilis TaxID=230819 RepID=A0A5C3KGZ0_COPMA|nr:hypothetical protein FA15DRAFT_648298 [Coprinopsis marcescibilis]